MSTIITLTAEMAKKACARFMSQWGPEDDENEVDNEEPYDLYEFGDND